MSELKKLKLCFKCRKLKGFTAKDDGAHTAMMAECECCGNVKSILPDRHWVKPVTNNKLQGKIMSIVSQLAEYCAHCGHLEPINADMFENESTLQVGCLVFVHLDDCRCNDNPMAHKMFIALANTMTHMKANDCLLSRAEHSVTSAMQPFSDKYLNKNSYSFKWINEDMTIK